MEYVIFIFLFNISIFIAKKNNEKKSLQFNIKTHKT